MGEPITLLSPANGAIIQAGVKYTIKWTTGGITGNVKIHLFRNFVWQYTIDIASNTGSYDWTVPSTQANGLDYHFKIESETDPTKWDWDSWQNMRFGIQGGVPAYREAQLVSCSAPTGATVGQSISITLTIQQGSNTENYVATFSGSFVGTSNPFAVNAGTGTQTVIVSATLSTAGINNINVSLNKV